MVWYGMVWYGMVLCSIAWYVVVWYDMVQHYQYFFLQSSFGIALHKNAGTGNFRTAITYLLNPIYGALQRTVLC